MLLSYGWIWKIGIFYVSGAGLWCLILLFLFVVFGIFFGFCNYLILCLSRMVGKGQSDVTYIYYVVVKGCFCRQTNMTVLLCIDSSFWKCTSHILSLVPHRFCRT